MHISTLSLADVEDARDLIVASGLKPYTLAIYSHALANPNNISLGVWRQRDLVGVMFLRYTHEAYDLDQIAIKKRERRQGVARALVKAGTQRARQRIELEVSEANVAARALYESLGFVHVGTRPKYYADGCAALLMNLETGDA